MRPPGSGSAETLGDGVAPVVAVTAADEVAAALLGAAVGPPPLGAAVGPPPLGAAVGPPPQAVPTKAAATIEIAMRRQRTGTRSG
jgi:hypothetical protein